MDRKEHRLNHKAQLLIINNLVRAGYIKPTFHKAGTIPGIGGTVNISWTKGGTEFIAAYAHAFSLVGTLTNKKIETFNAFLVSQAVAYLRSIGKLE